MAAHIERMERLEEAIFKQNEEINERMMEMFSLLKELTKSKSLKKVLVREEVSNPVTKYVNAISHVRMENDKGIVSNMFVDKNVVEPIVLVDKEEAVDDEMDTESIRIAKEDSINRENTRIDY
ncbi:hypothetical protein Tco_1305743 [Tanacetum coccineum]